MLMDNVLIMRYLVALIVGILIANVSYAGGNYSCHEASVDVFRGYHDELKESDSNTARFFNLKYLANEMEQVGIESSEFGERLMSYISSVDKLQAALTIESANVDCMDRSTRIIFRIRSNKNDMAEFLIVRLVDNKITNVSFEMGGAIIDGHPIRELIYKQVKTKTGQ